jgi:hypothetical protein
MLKYTQIFPYQMNMRLMDETDMEKRLNAQTTLILVVTISNVR